MTNEELKDFLDKESEKIIEVEGIGSKEFMEKLKELQSMIEQARGDCK